MFVYVFCLTILFFILTIAKAVTFGNKESMTILVDTVLSLGFAIWGLILIVLNWS